MSPQEPEPLGVDSARVLKVGIALWMVALLVSLLVPGLHEGDRRWWPWACAAGIGIGVLALVYVRRGRGNAEMAQPRPKPDSQTRQ